MSDFTGREEHPVLPLLDEGTAAFKGEEWTERFYKVRAEAMARMEADPLQFGYEPPIWKKADERLADFRRRNPEGVLIYMVLGGNRASKTEWRSKRLVENMRDKPDYKAWACHATQEASRDAQQKKIYRYLPPEYRADTGRLRIGKSAKVVYTPWGGFTEDVFAIPSNAGGLSECRFKFYGMNPRSLEGAEIDEGWMDEESSLEWLDALIWRAVTRNGIIFLTFTSKDGYTSLVKSILHGAVTLEEEDAELLAVRDGNGEVIAHEKVPRIQENLNMVIQSGRESESRTKAKASIIYFHASDNPFGNPAAMKATLEGANRNKILSTYYGVPTKAMLTRFPLFSDLVHVVSLNRFREIQKGGGTWYHFLDPAAGKNWFQQWIFVDVLNRAFVVGESPSYDHDWAYIPGVGNPGPWAVAGNKADGEAGDGQKEWGWGYARYIEEIERMERILALPGKEEGRSKNEETGARIDVSARWIDARYGNARRTSKERSTTLIEDLSELGMDFLASPTEQFIGGRGGDDGSLRMINDKLYYDVERPIDQTNQPHLYVVETCPNTRYALMEWTARDGQHGACKDPIDTLRMFVLSGSEHVDEALLQPITPWRNQFIHKGI